MVERGSIESNFQLKNYEIYFCFIVHIKVYFRKILHKYFKS